MSIIEAIILAIIEGITEFLPVSSTGHMIIGSALMGMEPTDFSKVFVVAIQLGAILSVLVLYYKRFFKSIDFYTKLFVGFLPAAFLGILLSDYIDRMLESPTVVAISLLLGGIFLLFVDKMFAKNELDASDKEPNYIQSLVIGFFQTLAMIPGVSRSAASIIGGLAQGLNRKSAAEFSFFLAVPTMFAATAKKLWDYKDLIKPEDIDILIIGNVVAFVVAMAAIKFFISFLTKHGFFWFGVYRIVVGAVLLVLLLAGYSLSVV
jgi:undecaprenyl-diphosphatase